MGILISIIVIAILLGAVLLFLNLSVWIEARSNHVDAGVADLVLMRLRRLNSSELVSCLITLDRAGVEISIEGLQRHALSGGSVSAVTEAMVTASKASLPVTYAEICAMDLAGRDVVSAVNTYVSPRVINCPPSFRGKKEMVIGMSGDGVRLGVQVKVTVRVDLYRLVGSAGDRTVQARVGEVIIRSIGRSKSHKEIVKEPSLISRAVEEAAITTNTSYELVSVDVLEVEVLDNVGAKLQTELSEAEKQVAQARAEAKKAEAVASRQEMKARTVGMRAEVLLSQSQLPSAVNASIDEANMGCYRTPVGNVFDWREG